MVQRRHEATQWFIDQGSRGHPKQLRWSCVCRSLGLQHELDPVHFQFVEHVVGGGDRGLRSIGQFSIPCSVVDSA
jgi:hypothetical protein